MSYYLETYPELVPDIYESKLKTFNLFDNISLVEDSEMQLVLPKP